MKREDFIKFGHRDQEFMTSCYPFLEEDSKILLWMDSLTFDFKDDNPDHDPLSKFTKMNYAKWKSEESNFDRFLDYIIEEYMPAWSIWYEGCREHDLKTEIYIRLGKKLPPPPLSVG